MMCVLPCVCIKTVNVYNCLLMLSLECSPCTKYLRLARCSLAVGVYKPIRVMPKCSRHGLPTEGQATATAGQFLPSQHGPMISAGYHWIGLEKELQGRICSGEPSLFM